MQEKVLDWHGLKIDTSASLPIDAQSVLEGITISLSGFLCEKKKQEQIMTNLNIFPIHKT